MRGRPERRFERIVGPRAETLDALVYTIAAREGLALNLDAREAALRLEPQNTAPAVTVIGEKGRCLPIRHAGLSRHVLLLINGVMIMRNIVERMTKGERDDLIKLIKQRERVEQTAAEARSKDLVADLEHQLGTIFKYDKDEVWAEAKKAFDEALEEANIRIAKRNK